MRKAHDNFKLSQIVNNFELIYFRRTIKIRKTCKASIFYFYKKKLRKHQDQHEFFYQKLYSITWVSGILLKLECLTTKYSYIQSAALLLRQNYLLIMWFISLRSGTSWCELSKQMLKLALTLAAGRAASDRGQTLNRGHSGNLGHGG